VLCQVLDNALESLTAGGSVTVAARPLELGRAACAELAGGAEPGRYVEVVVTDTGVGLKPEARARLFQEPFFSTKPRHRGLGLVIVCRILFAQKGGIRLDPGSQGGTVVRLYLPQAVVPHGHGAPA
jgi:signal transduction histidine kinase